MLRKGRVRAEDGDSELNLVPIMNLVVCLIPMVLFGASFVQLGVINVNTPKFGPLNPGPAPEEIAHVTVGISADRLLIQADRPLPGVEAEGEPLAIPHVGGDLDLRNLYNHLARIKATYPDAAPLTLTADTQIPFEDVVRVMDAARHRLDAEAFADDLAFRSARPLEGTEGLLWPDVVLASAE